MTSSPCMCTCQLGLRNETVQWPYLVYPLCNKNVHNQPHAYQAHLVSDIRLTTGSGFQASSFPKDRTCNTRVPQTSFIHDAFHPRPLGISRTRYHPLETELDHVQKRRLTEGTHVFKAKPNWCRYLYIYIQYQQTYIKLHGDWLWAE